MTKGKRNPKGVVSAAEREKYNFQAADLDNTVIALWVQIDITYIHPRERVQHHFLLDTHCWTGARLRAFFKGGGLKYEVRLCLARPLVALLKYSRMHNSCFDALTRRVIGI